MRDGTRIRGMVRWNTLVHASLGVMMLTFRNVSTSSLFFRVCLLLPRGLPCGSSIFRLIGRVLSRWADIAENDSVSRRSRCASINACPLAIALAVVYVVSSMLTRVSSRAFLISSSVRPMRVTILDSDSCTSYARAVDICLKPYHKPWDLDMSNRETR